MASAEDIKKLSEVLEIDHGTLESQLSGFPNRGSTLDMPPKDPTIYRLYEIVQNYGQAYKAVMHEKFGDGIMSAISFSTKVEKETDDKGEWAKITLRGKWYAYMSSALWSIANSGLGYHTRDSRLYIVGMNCVPDNEPQLLCSRMISYSSKIHNLRCASNLSEVDPKPGSKTVEVYSVWIASGFSFTSSSW